MRSESGQLHGRGVSGHVHPQPSIESLDVRQREIQKALGLGEIVPLISGFCQKRAGNGSEIAFLAEVLQGEVVPGAVQGFRIAQPALLHAHVAFVKIDESLAEDRTHGPEVAYGLVARSHAGVHVAALGVHHAKQVAAHRMHQVVVRLQKPA